MRVTLFVPCYIDACYPRVAMAVVHILERLGHDVLFDERITCCGQPAFNSGYWDEARPIAAKVLNTLATSECVIIPSGSCGAMIKVFYSQLFAGHPQENAAKSLAQRTYEFATFLTNVLGVTDLGAKFPARAVYHDGCHGLRELGCKREPRLLLKNVQGLDLVETNEAETCCGFGGTFAAKFPSISTAMGEVKCASAIETGAEYIISADSSCLMHLQGLIDRQKLPIKTIHLAEVLDTVNS